MSNVDKGLLFNWLSKLEDDDPRLAEINAMMHSQHVEPDEPYLSLKEVASKLGFADHSQLHRLRIQRVGERRTPSGRFKYKMSRVRAYLESPQAGEVRESLRRERRKRDNS